VDELTLPERDSAARRRERRAWYFYDWANSGFVTITGTVLFSPYLTSIAKRAACPGQDLDQTCSVDLHVLGIPVNPGSLAFYTVTVSTILSAVLLPLVGAIVDRSGRKRTVMSGFAWTGSLAASAMVFVAGTNWELGVLLLVVASLCLGSSLVVYDAILCDIAPPDERDMVSSRGWALGYLGGGLLLLLSLGLVTAHDQIGISTEAAVRLSLLAAGLWWGGFTIIPFRGLRDMPAPAAEPTGGRLRLSAPFAQLWDTLRHLRGYPQTMLFLIAYLFFNDGIQTVIVTSSVYGKEELGLDSSELMLAILAVQFVAFGGAWTFGKIATIVGAKRSIVASLVLWCLVVGVGYFLPGGRFGPFLVLAVMIGVVLGGSQALSRSLFSQLVPRGREAEYFSLYQAAERGTSWLGTLLFGLVFQFTHTYRLAILALVVFFLVGGFLLILVDVRRGVLEAGNEPPAVV
jgi:UMF1 family MFS transporter